MVKKAGKMCARLICTAIAFFFCMGLYPARAADGGETIRVALIKQHGLAFTDENGKRGGYDYEYLQEIAQYTGWNYEFVDYDTTNEDILEAMRQLEDGEVDLMTSLLYSDAMAETYDYAAYSHGSVYTVLAVLEENEAVTENTLFQNKTIRVATIEGAKTRMEEVRQFCAMSGVTPEFILCDSVETEIEAVRSGRADVLVEVNVNLREGMRSVARFAPRPYYFAATKGSTDIVSKLNAAILNINEADPYFAVSLYEKYFGSQVTTLHLSDEEKAYIRGAGAVRVAVFRDRMPMQDIDDVTGEYIGVSREVFDYITEATGLQFQFVPLQAESELAGMLDAGKVDLVAGMPYDYTTADGYDIVMSRPYLTAQTTYVLARGLDAGELEGKRLALSKGYVYSGTLTDQVQEYETVKDCLDALERGEADFAFNDSYTIQYYLNQTKYRNISTVPQAETTQKLCIGLAKPANTTLLTILNKTIRSIPEDNLQAMIYRNATATVKVTFSTFVEDNPMLVLGGVLVTALVIIGFLFIYFRAHIRTKSREALENERYKQLSELTNEHIFEYDYRLDRFSMSERSAKAMGMNRVQENYMFRLRQDRSPSAEKERELFERLKQDKAVTDELQIVFPDGRQRWIRVAAKVIADTAGKPVLAVGRLTDIQAEREELERLEEKAQRDSLTGVYNAETTRQIVSARLADDSHEGGALLVLDVDEFKSINDRFGHFTGDQALIAVARLLEDTFRRDDVVGRLGGDEFVVFMDGINERQVVESKCGQILSGMGELEPSLRELHLTVSIGGVMTEGEADYNRLYQQADKALYSVKESSRNGYQLI